MKKTVLTIILTGFIFGLLTCEKKPQTLTDYLSLSAESGKPVLIEFYTNW